MQRRAGGINSKMHISKSSLRKLGFFFKSIHPLTALKNFCLDMYNSGKHYLNTNCFDHAAAISFFSLLSIIPFLILLIAAAGYLAVFVGPDYSSMDEIYGIIYKAVSLFTPVKDESIRENLDAIIRARGTIGIFGIFILLLAASMAFGAIEHALKDIFSLKKGRKLLFSKMFFSVFLCATGVILFIGHYTMTLIDSFMIASKGISLDEWIKANPFIEFLFTYVPIPIGFWIIVYYFGTLKIKFANLVKGSLLFLFFWELARSIYSLYVTRIAKFSILYGSLSTPIILILWTFYTANILLFCLCFVQVLNERNGRSDVC
jgi:membrane protein